VSTTPQQLVLAGELDRAAEFRTALRRFLSRTADVCRAHGLATPTYDLLLLIRAAPGRREDWTVAELGERLALAPSVVGELVTRAARARLLEREDVLDGRVYRLRPTALGEQRLLAVFRALTGERDRLLLTFEQAEAGRRGLLRSLELHSSRDP
jgi:DNA-binding MarR family transcriptional regulator